MVTRVESSDSIPHVHDNIGKLWQHYLDPQTGHFHQLTGLRLRGDSHLIFVEYMLSILNEKASLNRNGFLDGALERLKA